MHAHNNISACAMYMYEQCMHCSYMYIASCVVSIYIVPNTVFICVYYIYVCMWRNLFVCMCMSMPMYACVLV